MLPWSASSSRKAARLAKTAGDWGLAAQHYRRALVRDARNAATWVQYGNALRECGQASQAEAAYRRSLELANSDPDAHVQLGHLFKQQCKGNEAICEYLRALELDPWLVHVSQELIALGWTGHVDPPGSKYRRHPVGETEVVSGSATGFCPALVIDATDLLLHFLHARLPTGIQRVQLQIIGALLACPARDYDLLLACFAPSRDFWVSIPEGLFAELTSLAVTGGAVDERPWQAAVLELTSFLVHGDLIEFPVGAVLVNLGVSWPHLNYFLKLRNAKDRYGIRFIPFVHDCVPVLMPELCIEETVRTYIDWLLGVFFHADGYLVNSNSTGQDLLKVAALLGHHISQPRVVRLDGRFSAPGQPKEPKGRIFGNRARGYNPAGPFVLLVSTFEPRKNHLLAFTAWLRLIEKRGPRHTPLLVCVGHRGWKSEPAMSLLRSNKQLQSCVRILAEIPDADLAVLYRQCLFTFYPSIYEGWGLPVTESLCHRKVPLITAVSSLPEAGGDFAEYFDLGSLEDLLRKLERLMDDQDYRTRREALISKGYRPRSWSAVAAQVVDYASIGASEYCESRDVWAPPAQTGRYYPIARSRETAIRRGMIAGEMFRIGEGWSTPEEWGCWLKAACADIFFSVPELGSAPCFLYVGLRGLPMRSTDFKLTVEANGICCEGTLEPDQYEWPKLRIEPRCGIVRLRIASNQSGNLAEVSGGIDRRMVSLGVVGFYLGTEDTLGNVPTGLPNHGSVVGDAKVGLRPQPRWGRIETASGVS